MRRCAGGSWPAPPTRSSRRWHPSASTTLSWRSSRTRTAVPSASWSSPGPPTLATSLEIVFDNADLPPKLEERLYGLLQLEVKSRVLLFATHAPECPQRVRLALSQHRAAVFDALRAFRARPIGLIEERGFAGLAEIRDQAPPARDLWKLGNQEARTESSGPTCGGPLGRSALRLSRCRSLRTDQ